MSVTLPTGKANEFPTLPGHYVVYRRVGFPLVVWWSEESTDWRQGYQRINDVAGWIGPLPSKRKEPTQ